MRQFPASPITALIDETPRHNLGESLGPELTVAELLGPGGLAGLGEFTLRYGTSAGNARLRALVAARHGIRADEVLITSGAASALFLVMLLCADGEILIGQPCYPPTVDALRGLGARVVTVRSRFEDGYRIDLDAFRTRLSARTQLVLFASPQNPSGVPLTDGEVERMLAEMSRVCPDALLLIDEEFREATYGDGPPAASFAGKSSRLLTCASLSKAHGAPGLRVGWLTVPDPALYERLRLAKFNSSLSCGTLDEFLATELLSRADEVLASRGAVLSQARSIVEHWIKALPGLLQWLRPQAGAFCCLRLDPARYGPRELDRFHAHLIRERTLVCPGPWFGDSAHIIRLGLAYEPPDKLQDSLQVISAALNDKPN